MGRSHLNQLFSYALIALAAVLATDVSAQTNFPDSALRVGTFQADITIPLGHRCMGVLETKAERIDDPLELLGLVILGAGKPVVIAALDWCEVRNGAYDQWRDAIATAAGTTRERVMVCSLHQHDAPVTDLGAQSLLDQVGLTGELYDTRFHEDCIARAVEGVTKAISDARPISHIGLGQAEVEMIASNRRVVHPDGSIRFDRYSRSGPDSVQGTSDRGQIDPMLKSISFFDGDSQLAVISHYATHPMSYYGRGGVSADFVGLARRRRQSDTPGTLQIYVTGCSGDVTAGKYNDGSPAARGILTDRLYKAMAQADEATMKHPASGYQFRSTTFDLPFHEGEAFTEKSMVAVVKDSNASDKDRILAAMGLSSLRRKLRGQPIDLPCLDLGRAQIVLLPGEAFVGYQLMAQEIRDDSFVMAIGFGECWPGYIPTKQAFDEGFGHGWRWVGRGSEAIIRRSLESVLLNN